MPNFGKSGGGAPPPSGAASRRGRASGGETPLLRLSPPELAQLLRLRREQVVHDMRQKHQLSAQEAERNLDQLLSLLDRFEAVTCSQRSEPGQASWSLRVLPRNNDLANAFEPGLVSWD